MVIVMKNKQTNKAVCRLIPQHVPARTNRTLKNILKIYRFTYGCRVE